MATYVPGSEQYLPDIKPFTPDYKFLSAVLDTRQGKYNTNWQATNDIYNKVVYADLSRTDTGEKREQYVNNLAPSLEKIAGMDLSLAQNAQSAKAVFAPFFEDKLIVKDMVKTANFRKQMSYANRLQSSVNFDQRDMWWADGVKELEYRMQDFLNMSPDEALNAPVYKYTPDADLGKMAEKILGEMKPPLKITYDHFGTNPDVINDDGTITKGKVNGDWIITTTNGEIVTGPALALINERLGDDPRVQKAYRTQAYVAGRDFAAEGMAEGAFSSVEEGQNAWAVETIKRIEQNNNKDIDDGTTNLAEKKQSTVRWSNYNQITGVIPGSEDDKLMKEVDSDFESVSNTLQNKLKIRDVINNESPDLESNLNRAYQLLQMTNLEGDMLRAAQAFSMRDYKSTMRETQAAKDERKFIYDSALEETRAANRFNLQRQKNIDDYNLAIAKGEVANPDDPTLRELNMLRKDYTDPNSSSYDLETEKFIVLRSDDQFFTKQNIDRDKQIAAIIEYTNQLNSSVGDKESTTAITTTSTEYANYGEEIVQNLTSEQLESFLTRRATNKKGEDLGYENVGAINSLFDEYLKSIKNKDEISKKNPAFVNTGTGYTDLLGIFNDIETQVGITNMNQRTARLDQYNAYNQVEALVVAEDSKRGYNVKGLLESGMPSLWYQDKDNKTGLPIGAWKMYTRKEYEDLAIELAQEGKLINFDRRGIDVGDTSAKYYMEDVEELYTRFKEAGEPLQYAKGIEERNNARYDEQGNRRQTVNKSAVMDDARYIWDQLQEEHNEALKGGNPEIKTSTFNSVSQRAGNTTAALSNYGVQVANVNPEIRNTKTDIIYATMLRQRRVLEEKGISPTFYIDDIDDAKEDGPLAEAVFDAFNSNFQSFRSDSRTSGSVEKTPIGKFVYGAVYGDPEDGNKTTAGYTFYPSEAWLTSSVKGGGGDGQYSGLNTQQRKNIVENGITMIFEQDQDISEGALRFNRGGNSIVAATIESKGGYWNQPVVVEDGVKGGEFSWKKINKNNYVLNYQLETYIPSQNGKGGDYVPNGIVSQRVNINPNGSIYGGTMSILEKQQEDVKKLIVAQGNRNAEKKRKDVATYKSNLK